MATNHPVDSDAEPRSNALTVYCPLCLARPGDPCEDTQRGFIVARPAPHPNRVEAVRLVGARCDGDTMPAAYSVPQSPADPEAAALELIQRLPGDILGHDSPPGDVLADLASLLFLHKAFTGLSWHDAKHAASAIIADLIGQDDAPGFLLQRADRALDGSDRMTWDDPAAMSRALTIGAEVLGS